MARELGLTSVGSYVESSAERIGSLRLIPRSQKPEVLPHKGLRPYLASRHLLNLCINGLPVPRGPLQLHQLWGVYGRLPRARPRHDPDPFSIDRVRRRRLTNPRSAALDDGVPDPVGRVHRLRAVRRRVPDRRHQDRRHRRTARIGPRAGTHPPRARVRDRVGRAHGVHDRVTERAAHRSVGRPRGLARRQAPGKLADLAHLEYRWRRDGPPRRSLPGGMPGGHGRRTLRGVGRRRPLCGSPGRGGGVEPVSIGVRPRVHGAL